MVAATETLDELSETTSDSRSAEIYGALADPTVVTVSYRRPMKSREAEPYQRRRDGSAH